MARIVKEEEYTARRNEILDTALQLLYSKGYEKMTIQDILDKLQISKGAFYHYFGSKAEVLEALVERILKASSNEGDVVLDPFCGCGTAVHAAQKLHRKWIGIDITHLAISLIEKRLKDAFKGRVKFEVHGTPKDLDAACDLAKRDAYQFQWWAVSLVDAQPFQGKKKGADGATLMAYMAKPNVSGRVPGVVVIHENRGQTEHIRDVVRRAATAGFVAINIDLLAREGGADRLGDGYSGALGRRTLEQKIASGYNRIGHERCTIAGVVLQNGGLGAVDLDSYTGDGSPDLKVYSESFGSGEDMVIPRVPSPSNE